MSVMNSTRVWYILRSVYFDFKARGEEIEEFNLNPEWYSFFIRDEVVIRKGVHVKIISRGWYELNNRWYLKVHQNITTTQYTFTIKE